MTENATPTADQTETISKPDQGAPSSTDTQSWRTSLTEEYRDKYTEFKTPEDFVKGYDGLVKKLGKNPLVRPDESASEEEKSAFRSELRKLYGVPDNQDAYSVSVKEGMPEEVSALLTDERLGKYKEVALDAGITPDAFDKLIQVYQDDIYSQYSDLNEGGIRAHEEAVSELKKEWGDDYTDKVKAANDFMVRFLSQEDRDHIEQSYGNDPKMVKMFSSMAERAGEKIQLTPSDVGGDMDSMRQQYQQLIQKSVDGKLAISERRAASQDAQKLMKRISQMTGSR